MSGLFERIARRRATPPDETQELDAPATAGPTSTGDEPAPTEVLATGEPVAAAPEEGVRSEAVAGEATAPQQSEAATNGEAPAADRSDAAANGEAPAADQSKAATKGEAPAAEQGEAAKSSEAPATERSEAATHGEAPTAEQNSAPADAPTEVLPPEDPRPSFRERGRVRRRVRYLRRLRELQLRDLGGLVFELRRFGRRREDLVNQKLTQLAATDEELRQLETLLDDRRAIVELREPGIGGTCPNCDALHGSADHYCAQCGQPLDARAANGAATSEATSEPRAE